MQAHQREQAQRFGLLRHQPHHQPSQPDGVLGEVPAGCPLPCCREVALIEQQVEHREDFLETFAHVLLGRDERLVDVLVGGDRDAIDGRCLGGGGLGHLGVQYAARMGFVTVGIAI